MDDISIELLQEAGREGVRVSGELTIIHAAQLKEALLRLIEAQDEVLVDIAGTTAIDLTGLQLLCAAHRTAGQAGKCLEVIDDGNAVFHEAAAAAGFLRHVGCGRHNSSSCIWVGGER